MAALPYWAFAMSAISDQKSGSSEPAHQDASCGRRRFCSFRAGRNRALPSSAASSGRLRWLILAMVFAAHFLLLPAYAESLKERRKDALFTRYGDIMQVVIPLSAAGYSLALGDTEGLENFVSSFSTTAHVTYSLKSYVGRPRPYQNPDGDGRSFPSGHTASAFAAASYVQRRYGWRIGGATYVMASAVGYSRVWSQNHYWTDVLAGAAIATASSYLFTKPYESEKEPTIQVTGWATGNGAYLQLSVKF